jgi:outer membrane protein assembly factor BamB
MNRHRMLLAGGVLLFASALCAAEGEWSRFRGESGAGLSDAAAVPVIWTDKDYNWKVSLPGTGHSSPVVWGERIYLMCGDASTAARTVLCLHAADGRILWRRDFESQPFRQHSANSYATASPAADAAGVVVTWSTPDEVILRALSRDGEDLWCRSLGPYVGKHGSGVSPIIYHDLVVLANDQEDPHAYPEIYGRLGSPVASGKSFLIAVDRSTGETRWRVERRTSLSAYSTPCLYRRSDGTDELAFTSTSHGITGLDPATGQVRWELADVFRDRCVGSPVFGGGLVIGAYGYGARGTRCVAVRPGAIEPVRPPTLVYEVTKSVPLVPTPIVRGDRLFLWCDDGVVTCLNVANGEVIWRERAGGSFFGSPVCVRDRLYCIAKDGEVVVLAAGDKFEVLARVPLGEPSFATPTVAGGVMYLRTHSRLFSLGGKRSLPAARDEGPARLESTGDPT